MEFSETHGCSLPWKFHSRQSNRVSASDLSMLHHLGHSTRPCAPFRCFVRSGIFCVERMNSNLLQHIRQAVQALHGTIKTPSGSPKMNVCTWWVRAMYVREPSPIARTKINKLNCSHHCSRFLSAPHPPRHTNARATATKI